MRTEIEEINISWLKGQAKKLKKEINETHTTCLKLIAIQHGYRHWDHLMRTKANQIKKELDTGN